MDDETKKITEKSVFRVFEEGRRFTEDLIKENERLRLANIHLKNELQNIENQYVKVDVIRMKRKVELLEKELFEVRSENQQLKNQFSTVEEENRDFTERYMKIERQHSDLVNLYVCMYRLHSTVQYHEVIEIIKEIVISLLGAENFAIYIIDETSHEYSLVGFEGMDESLQKSISFEGGIVGHAIKSGESYIVQRTSESTDKIIACIPLKIGEQAMGVLVIFKLVSHKSDFHPIDFDLFEILSSHAATAIFVSQNNKGKG